MEQELRGTLSAELHTWCILIGRVFVMRGSLGILPWHIPKDISMTVVKIAAKIIDTSNIAITIF